MLNIIFIIFLLVGFLMYCCCIVGARADEGTEQMMKQKNIILKKGKHYKQILEREVNGKKVKVERWLEFVGGKEPFKTAEGKTIKLTADEIINLEEGEI